MHDHATDERVGFLYQQLHLVTELYVPTYTYRTHSNYPLWQTQDL